MKFQNKICTIVAKETTHTHTHTNAYKSVSKKTQKHTCSHKTEAPMPTKKLQNLITKHKFREKKKNH